MISADSHLEVPLELSGKNEAAHTVTASIMSCHGPRLISPLGGSLFYPLARLGRLTTRQRRSRLSLAGAGRTTHPLSLKHVANVANLATKYLIILAGAPESR